MSVALLVRDYDEAIAFFTGVLEFDLVEDTYVLEQDKRWVLVAPPGSAGTMLLLARPSDAEQAAFVGNQTGGRVTFFLSTDDFWRDYEALTERGVEFVRPPLVAGYGTVAVFKDLYGNLWDLVEPSPEHAAHGRSRRAPAGSSARPRADRREHGGERPHGSSRRDDRRSREVNE